ncbi:hypothetical protein KI387_004503, partial [Taxus chinensis]
ISVGIPIEEIQVPKASLVHNSVTDRAFLLRLRCFPIELKPPESGTVRMQT